MITWLINAIGLLLILFIIIWFWVIKPKKVTAKAMDIVDILVEDGVYKPAIIKTKVGDELILRFFRVDVSPCAQVVMFEKLNISAELPIQQSKEITIKVDKPGEYDFTCQMGMYRGKLVVDV